MTVFQRVVKYCAMAFAVYLIVLIFGGIIAGVGGFSFLTDRYNESIETGDRKIYSVRQDIGEIKIDIGAVDCEIVTGEVFSVESNSLKIKVKDDGGRLVITDSTKNPKAPVKLKLTVPADVHIKNIDITAGAGDIYAEKLICSSLNLECGAGDVEIGEAVATIKANIEGGVGEITISSGTMNDLDMEMGVGSLKLTNRLKGECDLEFGVGDADITLIGAPEDYCINDDFGRNEGRTTVNIDKGIGVVDVDFAQAG